MAKTLTQYICTECAAVHSKWAGRCTQCGTWNSLEEAMQSSSTPAGAVAKPLTVTPVSAVTAQAVSRLQTASVEFDRVLGGGFVPGSVVLLGGEPGIGKSTLLIQLCSHLGRHAEVLYVSGEESVEQIGLRAQRLGISGDSVKLVAGTDTDRVIQTIMQNPPSVVIIDSIQTLASDRYQSAPGSVSQVRESAARLQVVAKEHGISVVLVGHVTKEGSIAGPKVLEHLVDVVLYLEGERFHGHRLLRGVKNRFGPTDEVGVFAMDEEGMHDVTNPAAAFVDSERPHSAGTGMTVTQEGTRALLVELQALTVETSFGYPKRTANGFDVNKLQLLIAVLSRHAGLKLGSADVYFNVSGGYRLQDPGADLAAALTVASGLLQVPPPPQTVVLGELGLSGEVRPAMGMSRRLAEAARAGMTHAIVPKKLPAKLKAPTGLKLWPVATVAEAVAILKQPRKP